MPVLIRIFGSFALLFVASSVTLSQGCSDAGFCTMGAMKPDQPFNKKINLRLRSMELSFYHASTITTVRISSITADLNFSLTDKYSFQEGLDGSQLSIAGMA